MKDRAFRSGHSPPRLLRHSRGFGRAYAIGFTLWLLATLLVFTFVLRSSTQISEREFTEYSSGLHTHLRDKLRANEAVLYGFASFLGAIGEGSNARNSAHTYARSVLKSYPHIYMLQIARKLARHEVESYTAQLRQGPLPDFQIRQFAYTGERKWLPFQEKPEYYPVVFMAPESPGTASIYGLDIDSQKNLKSALLRSEKEGIPISSEPFRLVEGDTAYVMFRPVISSFGTIARRPEGINSRLSYALLIMRASDLLPQQTALSAEISFLPESHGDKTPQSAIPLYESSAQPAHALERLLLPELRAEWKIEGVSQPLRLVLTRQMRLNDIHPPVLALAGMASILSLSMLIVYLRTHERQRNLLEANRRAIEHLALHDALTGLPNRFLLLGHIDRAISLSQRHNMKVGVLFLDLDEFKPINDRLGHSAGDIVLQEIAHRLESCIRDCDTAARFGGDEFVILLTEIGKTEDATRVAEKILQAVCQPISVNGESLQVGASIGIAICPENGTDAKILIEVADQAMYTAKQAGGKRHTRAAIRHEKDSGAAGSCTG